MTLASEQPAEKAAGGALHSFGIAFLAAFHDLDGVTGSPVRLVETSGLSIAKGNPVANGVPIGQRGAFHSQLPVIGQERRAVCSVRGYDRRAAGTGS
jgi:hypothetical protein